MKKKYLIATSKLLFIITGDKANSDVFENKSKNTYWHTNYAAITPYPEGVLIDMKNEVKMISVSMTIRYAISPTVGMKKLKMEGSCNGTKFTSLGEFNFAIANNLQNFPVSSVQAYRYLKVTALEPQRVGANHAFLDEIDIFSAK